MEYVLNRQDFINLLEERIVTLQVLCQAYDSGKYTVAKDIATCLRVLCHDTRHSTSLLCHIGVKDEIQMVSTMEDYPTDRLYLFGQGLYHMEIESGPTGGHLRYIPNLSNAKTKLISFDLWWNENVLKDNTDSFDQNLW